MAIYTVSGSELRDALGLCRGVTDVRVRFRTTDGAYLPGSVTGFSMTPADGVWRFTLEVEEADE